MIKTLIFDNNGVLTTTENEGITKMAELFNVDVADYIEVWKECAKPLDDGGISTEDFLRKVVCTFGSEADIDKVRELYYTCYNRDEEMHALVKELSKKYQVSLLSNFGDSFDVFEKKWRTHETINPENMFVSVKLGMRKPNLEIYEYTLSKLGIKPHEAVFIDDRKENVDAATELGIKGIVFKDKEQFLQSLEELTSE